MFVLRRVPIWGAPFFCLTGGRRADRSARTVATLTASGDGVPTVENARRKQGARRVVLGGIFRAHTIKKGAKA